MLGNIESTNTAPGHKELAPEWPPNNQVSDWHRYSTVHREFLQEHRRIVREVLLK